MKCPESCVSSKPMVLHHLIVWIIFILVLKILLLVTISYLIRWLFVVLLMVVLLLSL